MTGALRAVFLARSPRSYAWLSTRRAPWRCFARTLGPVESCTSAACQALPGSRSGFRDCGATSTREPLDRTARRRNRIVSCPGLDGA
jgi:hypothetical protein